MDNPAVVAVCSVITWQSEQLWHAETFSDELCSVA